MRDLFGLQGPGTGSSWLVLVIGAALAVVLGTAAYLVMRRALHAPRSRGIAVTSIVVLSVLGVTLVICAVWSSRMELRQLEAQLSLPATFHEQEASGSEPTFTLKEDGTVTVDQLLLGSEEIAADGRHCLADDVEAVAGQGRWSIGDDRSLRIEVDKKSTRLVKDDSLLMGEGWSKVYMLAPCDAPLSDTFVTHDIRGED